MHTMPGRQSGNSRGQSRDGLRTPIGVASWTGRSGVSTATNSRVSRAVACTTHRTRVSEMRLPAARAPRDNSSLAGGLGPSTPDAQELSLPLYVSG
jgi:hypothetical protein